MFNLELRFFLRYLAPQESIDHRPLQLEKAYRSCIADGTHWDHRKARVELHGCDGIASMSADEGLFEAAMRNRLERAHETGAKLRSRRSHLETRDDGVTAADAARHKHRHRAQMRQNFLSKHAGRDGADMAA